MYIIKFNKYLSIVTAIFLGFFSPQLDASCGSSVCPLDFRSSKKLKANSLLIGYDFEYLNQNQPRIGSEKAAIGEITGHHDEVYTINRIHRLNLLYAIDKRWNIGLKLPFVDLSHKHIHHHYGENITDTWNFFAIADMFAELRYIFGNVTETGAFNFGLTTIVKIPSGKQHIVNSNGSEAEPGIAAGTGSWDFKGGFFVRQAYPLPTLFGFGSLTEFFASVNYRFNTASHHEDYKIGNTLDVNFGCSYPFFSGLKFATQVNFVNKEADDKGSSHEETAKTGGEYFYISPGIEYSPIPSLLISSMVQIPLYQRVNQIQLTSDYNFMLHLAYTLDFN